jgi:hypothetical protein
MTNPPGPFSLGPDAGERLVFGEVTILLRATAEATDGRFTLFEEVPPLADTPLHVHANEDELFYVLEGEHIYRVGDEEFRLGPGGLVFAWCSTRAATCASRPRTATGPHDPRRVRRLLRRTRGGARGGDARARGLRAGFRKLRHHLALRRLDGLY